MLKQILYCRVVEDEPLVAVEVDTDDNLYAPVYLQAAIIAVTKRLLSHPLQGKGRATLPFSVKIYELVDKHDLHPMAIDEEETFPKINQVDTINVEVNMNTGKFLPGGIIDFSIKVEPRGE